MLGQSPGATSLVNPRGVDSPIRESGAGLLVAAPPGPWAPVASELWRRPISDLRTTTSQPVAGATGATGTVTIAPIGFGLNFAVIADSRANGSLTYLFIYHGEYLPSDPLARPTQLMEAQAWFEAYNTAHGGKVGTPK